MLRKFTHLNLSAVKASYRVANIIAAEGRPFTDGEFVKKCVLEMAEELCPESVKYFSVVGLSSNTITRRIEDLGADMCCQLKEKADDFSYFSIAIDESEDVGHTAQLLIFIRGINKNFEVTEELASLKSLKNTITGENIFLSVSEIMEELKLKWETLSCITTDGAKNMVGNNTGLIGRINTMFESNNIMKPIQFHCIIHQQSFCGKSLNLSSVMLVVISTTNFIRKKGLYRRQFKTFLETVEAEYGDLLYHSEVRWLSRGKILKRFFELQDEINIFMIEKLKPVAELSDPAWCWDLAFLTDITEHLNNLNLKLQGQGKLIHELFTDVKSFRSRLEFFQRQFQQYNFTHFPSCGYLWENRSKNKNSFSISRSIDNIALLQDEFNQRFSDFFRNEKLFTLFRNPFEVNVDDMDSTLQIEIIDLQSNNTMKSLFKNENISTFYSLLPESTFSNIKIFARQIISMFGSTYVCEQAFSRMKYIKSKLRSRLTDDHLQDFLKISASSLKANIDNVVERSSNQAHCSH